MDIHDLSTPAVIIDAAALERNLSAMSAMVPGQRLRPHVKAHKCTALAARQASHGHTTFTCATPREVMGMADAGLGQDLLLANETLDPRRLGAMASLADAAMVTIAVDSAETVAAAATAGIVNVLIDVNIGLPRCGVDPDKAGALADAARKRGLVVRGVMGYEGHLMMVGDADEKEREVNAAVDLLLAAHRDVGGDIVSSGGTGTYQFQTRVTEIQAGSYALMDTAYASLGLPFEPALHVLGTVISVNPQWAVADVGLKALAKRTTLAKLKLVGVHGVTDDGLRELQTLTELRELYVDGDKVTPAGRAELRRLLPKCGVLPADDAESEK